MESIVSRKFSERSILLYLPIPKLQGLSEKPMARRVALGKVVATLERCPRVLPAGWVSDREVQDDNVILL